MDNITLLDEIRSGSKEAIQKAYSENARDVFEYAYSLIHDEGKAKEITRGTFLKLFNNIKAGQNPSDLRKEAMNLAYDEAKPYIDAAREEEKALAEEAAADPITATGRVNAARVRRVTPVKMEGAEDDEKPVTSTQVIDISPAPEESDKLIAEAENMEEDEYDYYEDEYEEEEAATGKKGFYGALVIINIILILLLIWLLIGLLVNLGVLPDSLDLGYTWFNNTIYPIF